MKSRVEEALCFNIRTQRRPGTTDLTCAQDAVEEGRLSRLEASQDECRELSWGEAAGDIDELSGFWALIKLTGIRRVRAGERCNIRPGPGLDDVKMDGDGGAGSKRRTGSMLHLILSYKVGRCEDESDGEGVDAGLLGVAVVGVGQWVSRGSKTSP